jgi:5-methylcytosine-specific restriction endonuclease McrA
MDGRCIRCGKEFFLLNKARKYCSVRCREGQWKENNPTPKDEKSCVNCGAVFISSNRQKRFCSPKCNYSFHNNKRPTTKERERECPHCGKRFVPMQKRGVGRTYCSRSCKQRALYKRNHKSIIARQRTWFRKNKLNGNWERALKRDSYTCRVCGKKIYPSQWTKSAFLIVHHKDGSGETENKHHDLDNLVTLCAACHREFHTKINLVQINGEYFVRGKIFLLLGLQSVRTTI